MGIFLGVCTTGETKRSTSKSTLVGSLPGLSLKESSYNPATQDEFGRHFLFDTPIDFCSSGVFVSSKFTDSGSLSLD